MGPLHLNMHLDCIIRISCYCANALEHINIRKDLTQTRPAPGAFFLLPISKKPAMSGFLRYSERLFEDFCYGLEVRAMLSSGDDDIVFPALLICQFREFLMKI